MRQEPPIPLAGRIDRAIGFGLSQSGRYLHDYLYLVFNADEAGRVVFEGLMPHISGGKKTLLTTASASPAARPISMPTCFIPVRTFPFSPIPSSPTR